MSRPRLGPRRIFCPTPVRRGTGARCRVAWRGLGTRPVRPGGTVLAVGKKSMKGNTATLILNPKAGRGGAAAAGEVALFCERARAGGVTVEVRPTEGPGDAVRLAAEAARGGAFAVVVRGGDGTVHEAIQGLAGSGARLLVWPAGTANVLARQLGLPASAEGAARVLVGGRARRISLGLATSGRTGERRYFFMLAGVGLDASVVQSVRPGLKRRVGEVAFWYAGLGHLARWRPRVFHVEVDGERLPATYAAVGKAPWYGGGLAITPRARLEAEEFEVCVINTRSRLRYLRLLGRAMRGGVAPEGAPGVCFRRVKHVRATGEAPVQADGELIGELPMTFEVAPEGIEVIVPEESRQ
ncbi:MAG TPA: diacylglycerol kinase family protein [Pyrinomonadaceae bacterium]|nr:diacylglycerol kinase family protein [Pyrinomonadaceae bacterium]